MTFRAQLSHGYASCLLLVPTVQLWKITWYVDRCPLLCNFLNPFGEETRDDRVNVTNHEDSDEG